MITTKLKPMKHQLQAYDRFIDKDYGALFCEMGTGKTKIILDIIQNGLEGNTLVIGPNGLHLNWHHLEIPKHLDVDYACYCWKGTPTTKKAKQELADFMAHESPLQVLLG